jgi:lysozyme family protein
VADAKTAILITLDPSHEGGFQKNPNDRANWTGGQVGVGTLVGTNGGITALDMPGADIEHLTVDQKVAYYLEHYWKPLYSSIAPQAVASKLFDMGVLFGVGTAVKNLQVSLDLEMDGIFGPNTLARVNAANESLLLQNFKSELHAHAESVAAANPHESAFLSDWSRRIDS